MRERLCRMCGRWHSLEDWPHACLPESPQGRSTAIPVPNFISDTMDPTEHIDGRFYTSKSQFRATTKANDCTEIGNDPARFPKAVKQRDKAANIDLIKRAEHMVSSGMPVSAAK